jgi:D-alanyl-lipoteichoic acid acyltransferase DltB (MBOAT superfamily)
MLFNSIEFLIFLPIVFLIYWFVFDRFIAKSKCKLRLQNAFILSASYVFYGWWDWRFLILIAFTSLCSYCSGLLMEKFEGQPRRQRVVSTANIVINLGILGVFKYFNFFAESLMDFLGLIGQHPDWVTLKIILPVGISFYTFQALSYSIDVYKKKLPATHDIIEFFAYISFFPQLVAGPIERATNLLPQFQRERKFEYDKAVDGCRQMLWGLFKKIVVADTCAETVNLYWTGNEFANLPGFTLITLALLFSFQIYCDFSGYSDIAIGCARLFGFNLMRNFNNPYFARNISEFWRRWHISLMTWFRDYVYIPLGGSRCKKWKVLRNTFIVFGISGLWHGANWTFVCWGLYHAVLLALCIILGINSKNKDVVAYGKLLPSVRELLQMIVTFILTVIGWIIFRSESMAQATDFFTAIARNRFIYQTTLTGGIKALTFGTIILFVEWLQRDKQHALQFPDCKPFCYGWVRVLVYYIIFFAIAIVSDKVSGQDFIYFQF